MRGHGTVILPVDVVDSTHRGVIGLTGNSRCGRGLTHFIDLLGERRDATVLLSQSIHHGLGLVLLLLQRHLGALELSLDVVTLGSDFCEIGCTLIAVHAQRIIFALEVLGGGISCGQLRLEAVDDVARLDAATVLNLGILLSRSLELVDGLLQTFILIFKNEVCLAQLVIL